MLVDDADLGAVFDEAIAAGADPGVAANWLTGEVVAYLRREGVAVDDTSLEAGHIVELTEMVAGGDLSATAAKDVLGGVLAGEGTPRRVAADRDLIQISDVGVIEAAVDSVLDDNGDALERMRDGDMKPVGFLVGQVMRVTGGKADPKVVSELIRARANRTT
ncbi:MAG: Asp-tRNA(Asn)/Glu-tRNA(Gln) amidotransferase GatCAB subunit B, partial [Acidimicrobiia bacterium]|nr:Asp-tRNA(Asn)/Glu-tRNA(Gln) amidotransferase GatCAB subunit B [Acidimicrobiia bacterium]